MDQRRDEGACEYHDSPHEAGRAETRRAALRVAVSAARSAGLFLAVIVAFGVVVRSTSLVERHLIFFPDKELLQNPGSRGLEFEDVYFEASDGVRLNGWYVPGPGDVTLVWFHGNAGNMFHRRLGVNVFIFDYRGYGRSEGSPSEQGLYLDAEAAIKYLSSREDIDHRKLVLLGRSLGCAVAAEMATRHETYGVILESGFTSIQAMAGRAYPFLPGIGLFARAFIGTKLDTISKVGGIEAPLMVMHGDRDKLVPYDMGRQIFAAAGPPKRFHTIEGAGHDDGYLVGGPAYYDAVADFLRDPTGGED